MIGSPTIVLIDPTADLNAFYDLVWNVATAQGWGLDVWGRIVGVTRNLNIPADIVNPGGYSFTAGTYTLDNPSFRIMS